MAFFTSLPVSFQQKQPVFLSKDHDCQKFRTNLISFFAMLKRFLKLYETNRVKKVSDSQGNVNQES